MTHEARYGLISDIHEDPRVIIQAITLLKANGAEKLIINGDIGCVQGNLQNSQAYTEFILQEVAKSDLEAFVQPGSHEPVIVYEPVIDHFSIKFPHRIINTLKVPKAELPDHHLVFLPGSDFLCGGEYQIGNQDVPSGKYFPTIEGLFRIKTLNEYADLLQKGAPHGFHFSNMNDLKMHVTHPDKTVVICHVPRKFNNLETCVDMAEFGEVTEDFNLQSEQVYKGAIFPSHIAIQIKRAGYPIQIKKENRGNSALADLYDELGVVKSVTGHFHESSHRANDRNSNHVKEGQYVRELFWNSGHLDKGYTGILTVKGEEVKYQNINLDIIK